MALQLPEPLHMPCRHCGASVVRTEHAAHHCDPMRALDYRLFRLRREIHSFEEQFTVWLGTPQGRFAAWRAERDRR